MSSMREPRFETARRIDLRDELVARAKVWLPDWHPTSGAMDFAGALFEIAARLQSEVAQRLDKFPEKTFRGFLDWLGVRSQAAEAGRLPLVFALAAGSEWVLATAPIQVQATPPAADASTAPEPVTFETEQSLMLFPGRLASVVGVDAANDKFYLQPNGFSALDPPKPSPSDWTVQSDAAVGAIQVQLEPTIGLDALPTLLQQPNLQYRVTAAQGGLVTIDPPLGTPQPGADGSPGVKKGMTAREHLTVSDFFDPFGPAERNRQRHAVYIGSESLLNLPAAAKVKISGIDGTDVAWSYWGKLGSSDTLAWQKLTPNKNDPKALDKPAGSIEILDVGGKSSRWLRGTIDTSTSDVRLTSQVSLTVNCSNSGSKPPCPTVPGTQRSQIAIEGIANTTPLVLDTAFYPLGREPRLFDAFYLGCPEAFSKKNASVRICFEAVDGTAAALVAAQVGTSIAAQTIFFAVGADGNLHRLLKLPTANFVKRLPAVHPPFTEMGVGLPPVPSVPINKAQPSRLSTVSRAGDVLVAVTAGQGAWVWSQNQIAAQSRWYSLGPIADPALPSPSPDQKASLLLLRDGLALRAIALSNGVLYEARLTSGWETKNTASWKAVAIPTSLTGRSWTRITPVFNKDAPLTGASLNDGWIALDEHGGVLFMAPPGGDSAFHKKLGTQAMDADKTPLAVRVNGSIVVAAHKSATNRIRGWQVYYDATKTRKLPPVTATLVGDSFDWCKDASGNIAVAFATESADGASRALAVWFPQATNGDESTLYLSPTIANLHGAPAIAGDLLVAPGDDAAVLCLPFRPGGIIRTNILETKLASALVFDNASQPPVVDDFLETTFGGHAGTVVTKITSVNSAGANTVWIEIPSSDGGVVVNSAVVLHRRFATTYTGAFVSTHNHKTDFTADSGDSNAAIGDVLVIESVPGAFAVHSITKVVGGTITVSPEIATTGPIPYLYVETLTSPARILPKLSLTGVLSNASISAMIENGAYFRGAKLSPNVVKVLNPAVAPFKESVLQEPWVKPPVIAGLAFSLATISIFGPLVVLADTKTANPTLSWEYFDGQAWWKIPRLLDGTSSLLETGVVSFCVPAGLQATDVAGRKSYWIRARLVGGDYGQETVTVITQPGSSTTKTIQTVERSLDSITPPLYSWIDLQYSVCCASKPDYIVTADGGGTRDQTAANAIDSAQIELFMSLSESIRRAASDPPGTNEGGPSIFLGFDSALSGGPISVLFLLKDGDHDSAYPLRVDVLRETGFEPVVAVDGTRGLNESGVLTFDLSESPPAVTLFGPDARYWVRLRPSLRLDVDWRPEIRGAYLNGTFARAAETQNLERLGSSDGSPHQIVFLARPPVLEGTLELRVREPLGDEDIQPLLDENPASVLKQLPNGQAGPWVLWGLVDDPDDADPGQRAYSLDHATGQITFGNGVHGLIPPIGRDSIVAIRYKRGGGDAANKVTAWSQVNLVSPVQGVERVVAPEGAAGGSDPQTAEEIIRFAPANQLMRDRALTLRDFEIMALQSAREIAQVRAFPNSAGVRLVMVVRGLDPRPTRAQIRELERFLTERTTPMFAAQGAITINGPTLVDLRIDLKLTIDLIENSGDVARDAKQSISDLLDAATGGLDKTGWRLGALPTDTDIAACLDGINHLEEVGDVVIVATLNGVTLTSLQSDNLVALAPEGVNIQFAIEDVEVLA